jgi:hypothetical protein
MILTEQEQFLKSNDTELSKEITQEICNSSITMDEIAASIKRLKGNKACGVDGIPSEFFKYASESMVGPLTLLLNKMFDSGEFPEKWAEGLISPVHKQGSKNSTDNYRKITVMPVLGKIFESVLNSR